MYQLLKFVLLWQAGFGHGLAKCIVMFVDRYNGWHPVLGVRMSE